MGPKHPSQSSDQADSWSNSDPPSSRSSPGGGLPDPPPSIDSSQKKTLSEESRAEMKRLQSSILDRLDRLGLVLFAEDAWLQVLSFTDETLELELLGTVRLPDSQTYLDPSKSFYQPEFPGQRKTLEWMELQHVDKTLVSLYCGNSWVRFVDFCDEQVAKDTDYARIASTPVNLKLRNRTSGAAPYGTFLPKSGILAVSMSDSLQMCHLDFAGNRSITSVEFSVLNRRRFLSVWIPPSDRTVCCVESCEEENDNRVYAGNFYGIVGVYELHNQRAMNEFNLHVGQVLSVPTADHVVGQISLCPTCRGDVFAVRQNGRITVIDIRTGEAVAQVSNPCHFGAGGSMLWPTSRPNTCIWGEANSLQILDVRKFTAPPVLEWNVGDEKCRTLGHSTEIDSQRFATYSAVAGQGDFRVFNRFARVAGEIPRSQEVSVWRYDGTKLQFWESDAYHPNFGYRTNIAFVPGAGMEHSSCSALWVSEEERSRIGFILGESPFLASVGRVVFSYGTRDQLFLVPFCLLATESFE